MNPTPFAVLALFLSSLAYPGYAQGRKPDANDPSNTSPTIDQQTRQNDPYRASPPSVSPNSNPAYNNPSVLPGTPGTESQRGMGNAQGTPGSAGNLQTGPSGTGSPTTGLGSPGTSGSAASGTR